MGLDNEGPRLFNETVVSTTHGPPTLIGAFDPDIRIPVLPRRVASEVVAAADGVRPWISRFGLPFGLVAIAIVENDVSSEDPHAAPLPPRTKVKLNGPVFAGAERFVGATQVRLRASSARVDVAEESLTMAGSLEQTDNLAPNVHGFTSVLPPIFQSAIKNEFTRDLPLRHGDLSGYGLSTFSKWLKTLLPGESELAGITQVGFDVPVGRTSYEVIQLASRLWHPQARVIRTVIIERGNSANVFRYDSGWVAIEDGNCQRYTGIATGMVKAYRNIRNIRIVPKPVIKAGAYSWQEVLYDADLHLVPDPDRQPDGYSVPIRDHTGYVQYEPLSVIADDPDYLALMQVLGRPIGGPVDAHVKVGGTLAMQLSSLEVAHSPGAPDGRTLFTLAVKGVPALPRAGQWSAVAIDGPTRDVSPVDPRRGVPVVRKVFDYTFTFRDAATAYTPLTTEYGFLLTTPSARILFPSPRLDVNNRGKVGTDPPLVADPSALAMSTGLFPRASFALACTTAAQFGIDAAYNWKLDREVFDFTVLPTALANGAGWSVRREFTQALRQTTIAIDSAKIAQPWKLDVKPDDLMLNIEPFDDILTIRSAFSAAEGAQSILDKPSILFGSALDEVRKIIDALGAFVDIAFDVDVDVSAGNGPTPSFVVFLAMRLRLPAKANERVDIGIGKLRGIFELTGRLQASPSGVTTGKLGVELSGDLQQAIIPGVLFAGGQFLFRASIDDAGKPVVELGFGTAASVGGALIPGLIELEATVRYGYTLIPDTLRPGVTLGLEARASLLSGLIGFSFSADAMARIERLNGDQRNVTIWAEIRVCATVQIAVLIEEEIDFRTQFQQTLPLSALALAGGSLQLAAALEAL